MEDIWMNAIFNVTYRQRNNTWEYQIMVKDGPSWKYHSSKRGFKLKRNAQDAAKVVTDAIQAPTPNDKKTFKMIADTFILQKTEITQESYNSSLKQLESLHDKLPAEIEDMDVIRIITDYHTTHQTESTKSIIAFGRAVFYFMIKRLKMKVSNPFVGIELNETLDKAKKKPEVLTLNEMYVLFNKLDGEVKLLSMLMGLCGCRVSEARAVSKHTVDIDKATLDVHRQYMRVTKAGRQFKDTKSKARLVPMPPILVQEMKSLKVVPMSNDVPIFTRYYDTNSLRRAYTKAGYPDLKPHTLRHSYVTLLIQKGVDWKTIAYLVGDTVEVVMETYAHVNTDMLDNARKVIAAF